MCGETVIVIPCRMDSKRFPGKPLARFSDGDILLQKVYNKAMLAGADRVVVTSPDAEIKDHCMASGIQHASTSTRPENGTQRCAELIREGWDETKIVVNWQVDEPFVEPGWIGRLVGAVGNPYSIATLVAPLAKREQIEDRNVTKVAVGDDGTCKWFSRQLGAGCGHIGVYAYSRMALLDLVCLRPTKLAIAERLEQLTWLEHGFKIAAVQVDKMTRAINVPGDME